MGLDAPAQAEPPDPKPEPMETPESFRHEALLYSGEDAFLAGTAPFLLDAVAAGEPALVVVSAPKIERLRQRLGPDAAEKVYFADMAEVGGNPARIILAWRDFVEQHAGRGRRLRGIGEAIWADRSSAELVESQRHESLLNVAFDTPAAPAWWLMCPYDTAALPAAVVEEARRSHPFVTEEDGTRRASAAYRGRGPSGAPFGLPLPQPSGPVAALHFGFATGPLGELRRFVTRHAVAAGLGLDRSADLAVAVNEVVSNSLLHGGGKGVLRLWREGDAFLCEVRDTGHFDDPLAGRRRPSPEQDSGRGLWLANQLCDLLQIRTLPEGTVVRLHMYLRDVAPGAPGPGTAASPPVSGQEATRSGQ